MIDTSKEEDAAYQRRGKDPRQLHSSMVIGVIRILMKTIEKKIVKMLDSRNSLQL